MNKIINYFRGDKIIDDTSKFYKKIGLEKLVRLSERIIGKLDGRTRWVVESDYALGTVGLLGTLGIDALVHTDTSSNYRLLVDNGNWNFIFLCSYVGSAGCYFVGFANHIKYRKRKVK